MVTLQFEKEYSVHVYETGPHGRLTLYSLFDYFQDIASDHAVQLGYGREELLRNNNFWVLSRIYSEISELPYWGAKLKIRTWPRGTEKLFALRDFEVTNSEGKIIIAATSSWLIVDRTTKRVQRPDNTLSEFTSLHPREKALGRSSARLDPITTHDESEHRFSVLSSDLDINLHTNNVRYIKWVNDSYDLDFIVNNIPVSAEINYLAESHYQDSISVLTSNNRNNDFCHSILRDPDMTELCRVRIAWRPIKSVETNN